jgi:hypothetical protein
MGLRQTATGNWQRKSSISRKTKMNFDCGFYMGGTKQDMGQVD